MIDEALEAQAAAYALGALEPSEAKAFEAQLAGNAELRALVAGLHEVAAALAEGAPAAQPGPGLKDRVMSAARPARERRTLPRVIPLVVRTAVTPLAWAAAAGFALLAGYQQVRVHRRDVQVRELMVALDTTVKRLADREDRLTAILDGHTRMYVMEASGRIDSTTRYGAQVFWRRDRQTWLVNAYHLPRLPAGKVYQLWYITRNAKISAGVFPVDSTGQGTRLIPVPPAAQGAILAAMTVEPDGGSPQPTGAIVVAGSVEAPPQR